MLREKPADSSRVDVAGWYDPSIHASNSSSEVMRGPRISSQFGSFHRIVSSSHTVWRGGMSDSPFVVRLSVRYLYCSRFVIIFLSQSSALRVRSAPVLSRRVWRE